MTTSAGDEGGRGVLHGAKSTSKKWGADRSLCIMYKLESRDIHRMQSYKQKTTYLGVAI